MKILRNNQRSLSISVWKALGTESQEVVGILGTVLIKKKNLSRLKKSNKELEGMKKY